MTDHISGQIKLLEDVIYKNGFMYRKITRNSFKTIYAQIDKSSGKIVAYEVFKIKTVKPHPWLKTDFIGIELFPKNEDLGKTAWTFKTLPLAVKKYERLRRGIA